MNNASTSDRTPVPSVRNAQGYLGNRDVFPICQADHAVL
jgi:hypothetical protein